MNTSKGFWLSGLLLALALLLASCGGASSGGGADGGADGGDGNGGMKGMDHGSMDGGKHGGKQDGMEGMDHGDMGGMDHGGMSSGNMAEMSRRMVMPNGEYSDRAFIDAMVPHHQGAVEMAQVALKNAQHEQIRRLSRNIISSQESEIKELKGIKKKEYGTSRVPMDMSDEQMRGMGMMDPKKLAKQEPFDEAFINAMIPHHESAIAMANVALKESKNEKIRSISQDIVKAQKREISEMRSWRQQWYPEG